MITLWGVWHKLSEEFVRLGLFYCTKKKADDCASGLPYCEAKPVGQFVAVPPEVIAAAKQWRRSHSHYLSSDEKAILNWIAQAVATKESET